MKIELSEHQEQQLREGRSVEVVAADDQQPFVLLARDQFERVRNLLDEPSHSSEPERQVSPAMRKAQEAFWRELPDLLKLKSRKRQWAAFHGDERVCVTKHSVDAHQECLRRGLKSGEYYVGKIKMDPERIPPWGTFVVEGQLREFTEDDFEPPNTDET